MITQSEINKRIILDPIVFELYMKSLMHTERTLEKYNIFKELLKSDITRNKVLNFIINYIDIKAVDEKVKQNIEEIILIISQEKIPIKQEYINLIKIKINRMTKEDIYKYYAKNVKLRNLDNLNLYLSKIKFTENEKDLIDKSISNDLMTYINITGDLEDYNFEYNPKDNLHQIIEKKMYFISSINYLINQNYIDILDKNIRENILITLKEYIYFKKKISKRTREDKREWKNYTQSMTLQNI